MEAWTERWNAARKVDGYYAIGQRWRGSEKIVDRHGNAQGLHFLWARPAAAAGHARLHRELTVDPAWDWPWLGFGAESPPRGYTLHYINEASRIGYARAAFAPAWSGCGAGAAGWARLLRAEILAAEGEGC